MSNPLYELQKYGQSVWYDNVARGLINDGSFKKMIEEMAIVGVTSNPTIFEKAIGSTADYDEQIKELVGEGKDAAAIYDELAIRDIQNVCDVFRPVYDKTNGLDGYVSLEVNPKLAFDTETSKESALYYSRRVDRPNLMIKIPGTPEGWPAITATIAEGISVNVTMIFSLEYYEQVAWAYIAGLEKLVENGKKPLNQIGSVASFFVSRVDTLVDKLLTEKGAPAELQGKAAIANSKLAYEKFEEIFSSERFKKLEAQGATKQRMLWASTSTKNPNYRDVLYVEELVGPNTVDTMPPQTVLAFADHGKVSLTVNQGYDEARKVIADIEAQGISIKDVTDQLLAEGLKGFVDSYEKLLGGVETKRQQLLAELAKR